MDLERGRVMVVRVISLACEGDRDLAPPRGGGAPGGGVAVCPVAREAEGRVRVIDESKGAAGAVGGVDPMHDDGNAFGVGRVAVVELHDRPCT